MIWFAAATPPDGFLECNGQSTSGYSKLAAVVGAAVPNLQGKFIQGVSATESVGTSINSSSITLTFDNNMPIGGVANPFTLDHINSIAAPYRGADGHAINQYLEGEKTFNGKFIPIHVTLLPCIKY